MHSHFVGFVMSWLIRPILALNCMLRIELIHFEDDEPDDDPLTLASSWLLVSHADVMAS